jgi:transcriptional activator SPT7
MHITDRKERTDPPIPGDLVNHPGRPKVNGQLNGRSHSRSSPHARSPSFPKAGTPTVNGKPASLFPVKTPRKDAPFPDTPAIMRTPKGMALFSGLDWEISQEAGPSRLPAESHVDTSSLLVERLQQLSPLVQVDDLEQESISDGNVAVVNGIAGDKRKLYVSFYFIRKKRK